MQVVISDEIPVLHGKSFYLSSIESSLNSGYYAEGDEVKIIPIINGKLKRVCVKTGYYTEVEHTAGYRYMFGQLVQKNGDIFEVIANKTVTDTTSSDWLNRGRIAEFIETN